MDALWSRLAYSNPTKDKIDPKSQEGQEKGMPSSEGKPETAEGEKDDAAGPAPRRRTTASSGAGSTDTQKPVASETNEKQQARVTRKALGRSLSDRKALQSPAGAGKLPRDRRATTLAGTKPGGDVATPTMSELINATDSKNNLPDEESNRDQDAATVTPQADETPDTPQASRRDTIGADSEAEIKKRERAWTIYNAQTMADELGSFSFSRRNTGSVSSGNSADGPNSIAQRARSRHDTGASFASDRPKLFRNASGELERGPMKSIPEEKFAYRRPTIQSRNRSGSQRTLTQTPSMTDTEWSNYISEIVESLAKIPQASWKSRLSLDEMEAQLPDLPPRTMKDISAGPEKLMEEVQGYIDRCDQAGAIADILRNLSLYDDQTVDYRQALGEPKIDSEAYLRMQLEEIPHDLFRKYFDLDKDLDDRPKLSRMAVEARVEDYERDHRPKKGIEPFKRRRYTNEQQGELLKELLKLSGYKEPSGLASPTQQQIEDLATSLEREKSEGRTKLPNQYSLLKELQAKDSTYDFNPLPRTFDSPSDIYHPRLNPSLQSAITTYQTWHTRNTPAVTLASDPHHTAPVPKLIHRQLQHGKQLELNALSSHLGDLSAQASKRSAQLFRAQAELDSYKALVSQLYDLLEEEREGLPVVLRTILDMGPKRGAAVKRNLLFPPPTGNRFAERAGVWARGRYAKGKAGGEGEADGDAGEEREEEGKEKPLFARSDLPSIALQTHYHALVLKGKVALGAGNWVLAQESLVEAKKIAQKLQVPQLAAAVCLWQGIGWMGMMGYEQAAVCFNKVCGCNGVMKEAEMVDEWLEKLEIAKYKGWFVFQGRKFWGRRVEGMEKVRSEWQSDLGLENEGDGGNEGGEGMNDGARPRRVDVGAQKGFTSPRAPQSGFGLFGGEFGRRGTAPDLFHNEVSPPHEDIKRFLEERMGQPREHHKSGHVKFNDGLDDSEPRSEPSYGFRSKSGSSGGRRNTSVM